MIGTEARTAVAVVRAVAAEVAEIAAGIIFKCINPPLFFFHACIYIFAGAVIALAEERFRVK